MATKKRSPKTKVKRKTKTKSKPKAKVATKATASPSGPAKHAQTVIYVHGIGNKPPASVLKCQWDSALFGKPVGDKSRLAYWVSREYYPEPSADTCASGDLVTAGAESRGTGTMAIQNRDEEGEVWSDLARLADSPAQEKVLRDLAARMMSGADDKPGVTAKDQKGAKLLPVPGWLRRRITRQATGMFLRDVHDLFYNAERRAEMRKSLLERLDAGGGPFVIVAHSQGSMIAYDVLRDLPKAKYDVRLLLTVGSPLGLQEVQDYFLKGRAAKKMTVPSCVRRWVNIADRLDPVALDSTLRDEFVPKHMIEDINGWGLNNDSPRHPHSGTGYLSRPEARSAVREAVGASFSQAVGRFVIARDLVNDIADAPREARHPVLIEITDDKNDKPADEMRKSIVDEIKTLAGSDFTHARVDELVRFVSAKLTREEIETLQSRHKKLQIRYVWRNSKKMALLNASTRSVHAPPAHISYGAMGSGVHWAVLDTGIAGDHPHFAAHANVVAEWDCTQLGTLPNWRTHHAGAAMDGHGHGTHVAGIIAGTQTAVLEDGTAAVFAGVAPKTKLHIYKVLDDDGSGDDSMTIKALDHIAKVNGQAGELKIHGVNLSLGGPFNVDVYGCGHSPMCRELRRLWRQGVLVVIAAGNEGFAVLSSSEGDIDANMDLSISDPANLHEAIAVGATHKESPHTYGISYFSSRGPTADGRQKPDLVAPGERIISAAHDWVESDGPQRDDHYVEMSGTSMAAPHVSGLLAGFLSVRREFIGYPDRVKTILLDNCTSLERDVYIQGRGLPNLVKMLVNT